MAADAMLPELVRIGYIGIHGESSAKIGSVNADFRALRNTTAPRANRVSSGK
jgi:hypothetical protein